MVRSALRRGEATLTCRISDRLPASTAARIEALVAVGGDEVDDGDSAVDVLTLVKSDPGNVSLESMLTEIKKLREVRAIGLPPELFADVAPRVLAGWRSRAAIEAPSHLRDHPAELRLTLLAALLHVREREITDTLVDLLISTVHRINARKLAAETPARFVAFDLLALGDEDQTGRPFRERRTLLANVFADAAPPVTSPRSPTTRGWRRCGSTRWRRRPRRTDRQATGPDLPAGQARHDPRRTAPRIHRRRLGRVAKGSW